MNTYKQVCFTADTLAENEGECPILYLKELNHALRIQAFHEYYGKMVLLAGFLSGNHPPYNTPALTVNTQYWPSTSLIPHIHWVNHSNSHWGPHSGLHHNLLWYGEMESPRIHERSGQRYHDPFVSQLHVFIYFYETTFTSR